MITLIVNIKDNGDVKTITEALRQMRDVEKVAVKDEPMRRMTAEEFNREIDESLEDERMGRVTSHEDFKKEMARW